jgi:hypothetical protein
MYLTAFHLGLSTMGDREEDIPEAHQNTFVWLLKPESKLPQKKSWDDFIEWFKSGRGTYWMNGKAGSGKSTLMRFISKSEQTRAALCEWSGSSHLIVGNFSSRIAARLNRGLKSDSCALCYMTYYGNTETLSQSSCHQSGLEHTPMPYNQRNEANRNNSRAVF